MRDRFLILLFLVLTAGFCMGQGRKPSAAAKKQYELANNLLSHGKYQECIPEFQKALKLDSAFADCHMGLGMAYTALSQLQTANKHFSRVLAYYTNDFEAYYMRAINELQLKDTASALKDLNACILSKPDFANAWYSRGMIWLAQSHRDKALSDLNNAIAIAPRNAMYHMERASVYESLGNYRKAMADYDTVIMIQPELNQMQAYNNRASCRKFFKDIKGAIEDYSTIIKKYPGNSVVLINRGFAHLSDKNGEAACEDFRMAHLLGNPAAKNFLEKYCKGFFE
jgi:tetratricopeptide (TPR) repeat protein